MLTRELAAEPSFQLAQITPDIATASSRSADRFEWAATYRRHCGPLIIETIGEGSGGVALRMQDGAVRRFDLTPFVNAGPQLWDVYPRVLMTRGGWLGFEIADDWWRPTAWPSRSTPTSEQTTGPTRRSA